MSAERHGHASKRNGQSPTYRSWAGMKGRCENPNSADFPAYGGAGICIHPEWSASFSAFLAAVGERPPGTSIDRIDGRRGYVPGNVRWATAAEQSRNRWNVRPLTLNGETMLLTDWAARTNIAIDTLRDRLGSGWSVDDALTRPVEAHASCGPRLLEFNGERMCIADWSRRTGISADAIETRVGKLGWATDRALTTPARASHRARLTATDAERIRSLIVAGVSYRAIAAEYGVSESNISVISTGRSFKKSA